MLDGMTLYPETIGYADNSKENPLGDMENHISQMIDFGGGVAGGFYHPYLGMKYLPSSSIRWSGFPAASGSI